ncbi:hypothetical protein MMC31_001137 [Peltigera leucophlebia]|nr:hypothetical protein [Peltigera leucophlebia]
MDRNLGANAENLAEKFGRISPRREAPSTPAPFSPPHTPTPPSRNSNSQTVIEENLIREREAYETLIQEGGQPSWVEGLR